MLIKDLKGNFLSISEMAQIHGISRQTLIYYDKIGLFSPEFVDENGYRYYNSLQIPLLREICFLKSIGIALEDIKINNKTSSSNNTVDLLERQKSKLDDQLNLLLEQKNQIKRRVKIYKSASEPEPDFEAYEPRVEHFPLRRAVWLPWYEGGVTRRGLHETLLQIWDITASYGYLPNRKWGAVLFKDYLDTGNPLYQAGGCTFIPPESKDIENSIIFPEGEYICIEKYGMPYELCHVEKLIRWIYNHGYKIVGNVYDECVLDTIFYDSDSEVDFCQLQIPVAAI